MVPLPDPLRQSVKKNRSKRFKITSLLTCSMYRGLDKNRFRLAGWVGLWRERHRLETLARSIPVSNNKWSGQRKFEPRYEGNLLRLLLVHPVRVLPIAWQLDTLLRLEPWPSTPHNPLVANHPESFPYVIPKSRWWLLPSAGRRHARVSDVILCKAFWSN